MKNTEIFYFDIDGTLYNNDLDYIEQETFDALAALQAQGYKIALSTGRTLDGLKTPNIVEQLDWDGFVLANGAQVLDRNLNQIYKVTLPKEYVSSLIATNPGPLFLEGDYNSLTSQADERVIKGFAYFGDGNSNIPPVINYTGQDVYKIVSFHVDLLEKQERNPIFDHVSIITNAAGVHEIYPKNVSKYEGIKALNKHLGVNTYTGFGDGNNDFEFLENADYAVAMENSPKKLKEIADFTTISVSELGVVHALKYHKLI